MENKSTGHKVINMIRKAVIGANLMGGGRTGRLEILIKSVNPSTPSRPLSLVTSFLTLPLIKKVRASTALLWRSCSDLLSASSHPAVFFFSPFLLI